MLNIIVLLVVIFILSVCVFWFLKWFDRDPKRSPPTKDGVIVSPSDGRIKYVDYYDAGVVPIIKKFSNRIELKEIKEYSGFSNGVYVIGTYLSPFDVHITRSPISGKIIYLEKKESQLLSKAILKLKTTDEKVTCIVNDGKISIMIVQMAAYIIRRVISYVQKDEKVTLGQRIGKIKFGSQVDLVLPNTENLDIIVKPGDRLKAGETVVAILHSAID